METNENTISKILNVNYTQTQLTIPDIETMDSDLRNDLVEAFESISFLSILCSANRPLNPVNSSKEKFSFEDFHILRNMDYFTTAAKHFEKHGTYTLHHPNSHPSSQYHKFWKQEAYKCREGMKDPVTGIFISGDFYFYLNYSPIYLSDFKEGTKHLNRIEGFPKVYDGDYLWYKIMLLSKIYGNHDACLKSRGKGFSYKNASGLAKRFILGEGEKEKSGIKCFAIANEKEYLSRDGILNKFVNIIDHCAKFTPFPKARTLKDSWADLHWKMGYKDKNNLEKGVRNEVMGVSLMNNPEKARGKRGSYMVWEEAGKFPFLLKAWQIARSSVEEGNFAFGTMVAFGTGGTSDSDFAGLSELFYSPNGYNVYGLPNVFDKNMDGKSICGFFFPEYLNRLGCYDTNGNSDCIKALIEIFQRRIKIKRETNDANTLIQEMAELPITPQEALSRVEGSVFPVNELKTHLADIMPRFSKFVSPHWIGNLVLKDKYSVTWRPDATLDVLREFPFRDVKSKQGAVEIFEMPFTNEIGEVPSGIYIAGIDTIDDDDSSTKSLFSCFIMNSLTERIVAEYTGRTFNVEEVYETTRRLLLFYNASANYENNKKGLYAYFKMKDSLHLLCETPEIIKDMELGTISKIGNKSKGTNATNEINSWGRKLQASWMIQTAYNSNEDDPKLNIYNIRSIGYIKECIAWNPNINCDRVSAMGMLMILKAQRSKMNIGYDISENDLSQDKFWDRNFKKIDNFANAAFVKENKFLSKYK